MILQFYNSEIISFNILKNILLISHVPSSTSIELHTGLPKFFEGMTVFPNTVSKLRAGLTHFCVSRI